MYLIFIEDENRYMSLNHKKEYSLCLGYGFQNKPWGWVIDVLYVWLI